jgi:hypothetical protein
VTQLDRLRTDRTEIRDGAKSIEEYARSSICGVVGNAVDQLIEAALATEAEDARRAILERAASFWTDREIGQAVDEWAADVGRRVGEWRRESDVRLNRRLRSYAFQRSLGPVEGVEELVPVRFPGRPGQRALVKDGTSALTSVVNVASTVQKARVARAGLAETTRWLHTAGTMADSHRRVMAATRYFMADRQITRIAQVGGRATVVMTVAFTVADLMTIVRDRRAGRRTEEEFREQLRALREQTLGWAVQQADSEPALIALGADAAENADRMAALTAEIDDRSGELQATLDRLATYVHLMERGRLALATRRTGPTR